MFNNEKIDKIGLIAGSGNLPLSIVEQCKQKSIKPYVLLMKNFANEDDYKDVERITINFGDVGKALSFFKKNNIKYVVFAGAVKKPDIKTIWPDLKGFSLLFQLLKCKIFGDDTILQTVIKFLEKNGLQIVPVDSILDNSKIEEGIAGNVKLPNENYKKDIELGINVLKTISDFDIGQSIVVQNGMVVGIECIEGTKELIKRCNQIKYNTGRKPVLIKIKKINQTKKADLPTIGENTILEVKEAGFAGIAIDYQNTLVINKEKTIELANKEKIFLIGIGIN